MLRLYFTTADCLDSDPKKMVWIWVFHTNLTSEHGAGSSKKTKLRHWGSVLDDKPWLILHAHRMTIKGGTIFQTRTKVEGKALKSAAVWGWRRAVHCPNHPWSLLSYIIIKFNWPKKCTESDPSLMFLLENNAKSGPSCQTGSTPHQSQLRLQLFSLSSVTPLMLFKIWSLIILTELLRHSL